MLLLGPKIGLFILGDKQTIQFGAWEGSKRAMNSTCDLEGRLERVHEGRQLVHGHEEPLLWEPCFGGPLTGPPLALPVPRAPGVCGANLPQLCCL